MSKREIEDVTNNVFKGETQRGALDLIAHLKANEFTSPAGETLECVKKMIDARKNDILANV